MTMDAVAHHARIADRIGMSDRWRMDAACYGRWEVLDPPGGFTTLPQLWEARALCGSCPVIVQCRESVQGMSAGADPGGMIAGLTWEDRSRIRHSGGWRDPDDVAEHECVRCHVVKPREAFGTDPSSGRARLTCTACCAAGNRKRAMRARRDA